LTVERARTRHESADWVVTSFVGGNRWKANTYLATRRRTSQSVLIDPGGDPAELLPALRSMEAEIEFVLLTHGHFDHISAASVVCEEYRIACVVHPADVRLLRHAPFYALRFDGSQLEVPKAVVPLDAPGAPDLSERDIRLLPAAGHTPGGICIVLDPFVVTGDTLLREAVGRTDPPIGDPEELVRSVERILSETPRHGIVLPGHGDAWTIPEAREWWKKAADSPVPFERFL